MKKIFLGGVLFMFSILILASCFKHSGSKNSNEIEDNVDFLYGPWISEVKLPMTKEQKGLFYRAQMGNDVYFRYGKEQVELIFTELKNRVGNIEGGFVRENSKYRPLSKLDNEGFRHVKININERGEENFFRYKIINANRIEIKMITDDSNNDLQKFDVFFKRENR